MVDGASGRVVCGVHVEAPSDPITELSSGGDMAAEAPNAVVDAVEESQSVVAAVAAHLALTTPATAPDDAAELAALDGANGDAPAEVAAASPPAEGPSHVAAVAVLDVLRA